MALSARKILVRKMTAHSAHTAANSPQRTRRATLSLCVSSGARSMGVLSAYAGSRASTRSLIDSTTRSAGPRGAALLFLAADGDRFHGDLQHFGITEFFVHTTPLFIPERAVPARGILLYAAARPFRRGIFARPLPKERAFCKKGAARAVCPRRAAYLLRYSRPRRQARTISAAAAASVSAWQAEGEAQPRARLVRRCPSPS